MAGRVNALLVIGELNQQELKPFPPTVQTTPPVPLPAGTAYLLQTFEDVAAPSVLRATAQRCLVRHVQLGLPNPADAKSIQAAMMKAAVATTVPKDCTDEAHEWMRRRAVELLGMFKDPAAAKIMIDVVADEKASFAFRCEAARALGMLALKPGDPNVGNAVAARHLGELAATVAESSTERFNHLAFTQGDYYTDSRRLYEYLECVRVALNGASRDAKQPNGLRTATPAADAKVATDLVALIDPLMKDIDPEKDRNRSTPKFTSEDLAALSGEFAESVRRAGLASLGEKPKAKKKAESPAGKEAAPVDPKVDPAEPDDGKTKPAKTKQAAPKGAKIEDPKAGDPKAAAAKSAP
jgi:hypothetical protein